jgi:hypothetical protein
MQSVSSCNAGASKSAWLQSLTLPRVVLYSLAERDSRAVDTVYPDRSPTRLGHRSI